VGQRENLPTIADAHLDAMRAVEKPIADPNWRSELLTLQAAGSFLKGKYELRDPIHVGPVQGSLYLFVRVALGNAADFTAGLAFVDDAGNGPYRLLRCNGFHPGAHTNVLEGGVIAPETTHVHTATERYLNARDRRHDGYAVETNAYNDLAGAVSHLVTCVNLSPEGMLML
jgi:hypothetical protein